MRHLITISILAFYLSIATRAQTQHPYILTKIQQPEANQGKVQIIQDKRIDELLGKVVERNAKKGTVRGYRIQIFRENSQVAQEKAVAARSRFLNKFPDVEAYLIPKVPLWRVYVGDFRTLNDAYRMLKQLESLFPNAFIVQENIDYNKF